jgi:hypothetical protein
MSSIIIRFTALALCLALALPGFSQRKEDDSDVNYDESRVPNYDLPPLLVTAEGKRITTPEEWRNVRRPPILSLFSNLVYGGVPEARYPVETGFETVRTDHQFMGGIATRRDVSIRFSNELGSAEMLILVFTPNDRTRPVPAFLKHSFDDTRSDDFKADTNRKGLLKNGWPLAEILDRGFGFVAVYQLDLVSHNEVEFRDGIHPLFYGAAQSFPKAIEAVKVALELGNDINAIDNKGETAMHGAAYKQLSSVVTLLAESGANMQSWNQKNDSGWTPLRIAAGVYRTANFRFSDPTAAVFRELMSAAGISTVLEAASDAQALDAPADRPYRNSIPQ